MNTVLGHSTSWWASAPAPDADKAKAASEGFDPGQLLPAGIILGAAIAIGLVAKFVVGRLVSRSNEIIARLVARTALFLAVTIGLVYALSTLGIRVGLLLGGLGIGGFALAFAMKDTLENLIAGVFLQMQHPFDYDDLVQLGEFEGSVDDIHLRSVEMTLFSGERVILPSSEVLHNPIVNLTANGTRRVDIGIGVSYDADVFEACDVITDAMGSVDEVLDDPAPMTTFDGFGDSSVDLTARYWIDARGSYFDIQRAVADAVKRRLEDAGIDIPFPTRFLAGSAMPRTDGDASSSASTSEADAPGRNGRHEQEEAAGRDESRPSELAGAET